MVHSAALDGCIARFGNYVNSRHNALNVISCHFGPHWKVPLHYYEKCQYSVPKMWHVSNYNKCRILLWKNRTTRYPKRLNIWDRVYIEMSNQYSLNIPAYRAKTNRNHSDDDLIACQAFSQYINNIIIATATPGYPVCGTPCLGWELLKLRSLTHWPLGNLNDILNM